MVGSITLQNVNDIDIIDGDVLGRLAFAASSETGAEALKVTAMIEAVAEKTFDASNNATEFVFSLAGDGTAASKMTLGSAGLLTLAGGVKIKEASAAVADTNDYGQLWVKTATPNQLYFTTDAGNDIQITSGALMAVAVTALNSATANELVTVGSTTTELDAEASLTYDDTNGLKITSATSALPILTIENTNDNATGATLKFNKNGTAPVDGDVVGNIDFVSEDSASNPTTYARIQSVATDVTTTSEQGQIDFYVAEANGTLTKGMALTGSTTTGEVDVTIGAGSGSVVTMPGGLNVTSNITMGSAVITEAELEILDGASVTTAELNILNGVISTTAELNIIDGNTAATSTTLADDDRVVVNDNGTMVQVALTDFETYFESALDTLSNVTTIGTISFGVWAATDVAVLHGGTGASTAGNARTNLGITYANIGTVDISANTNLAASTGITLTGDTLTTNDGQIVHDNLSGAVANEHIDHTSVSITAGVGLSGGGTIAATRTLTVDFSEFSDVTPANGDKLATLDSDGSTEQLTTIASLATLFAGTASSTGLSASSSVLSVSDLHSVGVDGSANQLLTDDGDGTVTSESQLTHDPSLRFLYHSTTDNQPPRFELKHAYDDTTGSEIRFTLDKGEAGLANDVIGIISFWGDDAGQGNSSFAQIEGIVADATAGAEDGLLKLSVASYNGTLTQGLALQGGGVSGEVDATIGAGAASIVTIPGDIDLAGDIDVDGTLEADAITVGGTNIVTVC